MKNLLRSALDDAGLRLQAGQAELASKVLTRLVPVARETPADMP